MSKLGVADLPDGDKAPHADSPSSGSLREHDVHAGVYIRPQDRRLHDPSVTFEEYYYYAQRTRIEEDEAVAALPKDGFKSILFPSKSAAGVETHNNAGFDAANNKNLSDKAQRMSISDDEWTNASRALRTASWGAVFYLITTDILGPFGLPYAFATMGWYVISFPKNPINTIGDLASPCILFSPLLPATLGISSGKSSSRLTLTNIL